MKNVMIRAEALAKAILESEEYMRMRLLEQAVLKDEGAGELVAAYSEQRGHVEELLAADNPNHGELAKAGEGLEAAEKALDTHALIFEMRSARQDFAGMMKKVNAIIRRVVTGESAAVSGCGESCQSCGGCAPRQAAPEKE